MSINVDVERKAAAIPVRSSSWNEYWAEALSLAQMLRPEFLMYFGGLVFEVGRANHGDGARAGLQHRPARHVQPDPCNLAEPRFGARKHHTPDARPVTRSRAHRARLGAGIERAIRE